MIKNTQTNQRSCNRLVILSLCLKLGLGTCLIIFLGETMKLRNLISLALVLTALSTNTMAQSVQTSTTKSNDLFSKIAEKTSLFLFLGLDAQGTTDTYTGYTQTNIAYLSYNITDNDSLRLETRVSINNPNGQKADTTFSRSVLKYTRSGILNQDKHGINLKAAFEKRYLPDTEMRNGSNTYGLNRLSVSASRTINDKLSVGATAYVALSDLKDKTNVETSRNYYYLVLTETLALPYDVSLTFVEEFFKNNNKQNSNEYNSFDLTAEFSKSLTDKMGTAFYVAGSPIASTTNSWEVNSDWTKMLRYGVSFTYSAF